MSRRKCRSFIITDPSRKKRVVIGDGLTMKDLLDDLAARFSLAAGAAGIKEIRDESGCAIDRVDDIFSDDTLVIVPVDYEDPAPDGSAEFSKKLAADYSSGAGGAGAGSGSRPGAVMDPESVVELQVLSTTKASDFVIDFVVGGGQNGMVFATKCTRPGLPRANKTYATKLVFNFGITTKTGAANTFENEYYVLTVLPPHPNVMRFWATFWDKIPEEALPHLPKFVREQANYRDHTGASQRRKAQFVIVDYHPQTLQSHLKDLPTPLPYRTALEFTVDLLQGVAHLERHRVAHLDLKPDNILVAHDSRLVICDFGTAVQFTSPDMEIPYRQGLAPGGNQLHLAPEVLNSFNAAIRGGRGGVIRYSKQEVWAVGVLVYEMALHTPPFPDYPNDCRSPDQRIVYTAGDLPPLPSSYAPEFKELVTAMLAYDPAKRIPATEALRRAQALKAELPEDIRVAPSVEPDESKVPCISITVKSVTGQSVLITTPKTTRVADLKTRAAPVLLGECPFEELFMLFAGTKCEDDMTLDEVGVEGESCLHLVRRAPAPAGGAGSGTGGGVARGGRAGRGGADDADSDMAAAGGGTEGLPHFNVATHHPALALEMDNRSVVGSSVTWGTAVVDTELISSGRHCWQFQVDALVPANRGGMAIGIVAATFDTRTGILGAHINSWGYSGRTGDKGNGSGFMRYGERYGNGDIIGVDLDLDAGTLSFSKNGVNQGVAFDTGLAGQAFLAGVCIGGVQKEGGHHQVTVLSYVAGGSLSFSTSHRHPAIQLRNSNRTALSNKRAWGTCLISEPPTSSGHHTWEFMIDKLDSANKGGMAIGIVTSTFSVASGILGANVDSWAYSGRTGDKGDGSGRFVEYGEPYGTGDRVGIDLDMDTGVLRFTKNGHDQGVAYEGAFKDREVHAAVCIGGVQVENGYHQVTLVPRSLGFSTERAHELIQLSNNNCTATGSVKQWGTVLVDGVPVGSGRHVWRFKIDKLEAANKGGMAIGVVTEGFDYSAGILGAHAGSWGYSGRTGDKGDGVNGFQTYGDCFNTGDVVTVTLDMDIGTLSFAKNGVDQGVAFRAEGLLGERLYAAVCIGGVHRSGGYHSVSLLPS